MPGIRSFIAVEVPENIRNDISKLVSKLKDLDLAIRWVPVDNIHLTLKFLGDVEEKVISEISWILERVSKRYSPFNLYIEGAGVFPGFRAPRVIWFGVRMEDSTLLDLVRDLENELALLGFKKEKRPFSPHLTLGRVKQPGGMERLKPAIQGLEVPSTQFLVKEVLLMKSTLTPKGSIYSTLQRKSLR
ncbi:MAG: RNA 2',3'-cyclic phosphodiesterase [Fidelibacterota bacterium]